MIFAEYSLILSDMSISVYSRLGQSAGQTHLIFQNSQQIIIVPTSLKPFPSHSDFGRLFVFEQIQCDSVNQREILCCISCSLPTMVLVESDIQYPMQRVLDSPMRTDRPVYQIRIRFKTVDIQSDLFQRRLPAFIVTFRLNPY